jgi:hypothetical protein
MLFLLESVQVGDPSHGSPGSADALPEEEIPGKRGWNPSEEQILVKNCWASSRRSKLGNLPEEDQIKMVGTLPKPEEESQVKKGLEPFQKNKYQVKTVGPLPEEEKFI